MEVPAPVIEVGLKAAVTPVGRPLVTESVTAELKPPVTVSVMVEVPVLPSLTEAAVALNAKLGVTVVLDRVVIRLGVGLPQPVTRSKPVTAE